MQTVEASPVVLERPETPAAGGAVASPRRGVLRRTASLLWGGLPTALSLALAAGVVFAGQRYNWSLPKASALRGEPAAEKDDWCEEHSVPESECVECRTDLLPPGRKYGWCRTHGVHECPLEHPGVAQLSGRPEVTTADFERAKRALDFAPRPENNSKCKLQERRIQFASGEMRERLGVALAPVSRAPVTEYVAAPGEIAFDPTRVARLSSRVPGSVFQVEAKVGDKVRTGDVLALVESAEVGRVKGEFQQALVQFGLREQGLKAIRSSGGAVPERNAIEAEALLEESRVRLLTAEQALSNLGMAIKADEVRTLSPEELVQRMQFLGVPKAVAQTLSSKTQSSNLIAVTAPFDGEVVTRNAVAGEASDPAKVLFVVADTSRLWLTLRVRSEDANRVKPGHAVRFQHAGHEEWDTGTVSWVSPAADEKSRTVPVRVNLTRSGDRHHANTFGTGRVILREEKDAVVVPSEAVHWEGCCHVVFVRDRRSGSSDAPEVFHVRKVRPGAKDVAVATPVTEMVAGVLPGEMVATANSGVLRSELLKNNLGEG